MHSLLLNVANRFYHFILLLTKLKLIMTQESYPCSIFQGKAMKINTM